MSMPPSSRARCSRLTHVSACGSTLRSSARCAGHAHDDSSSDLRACALFSHTIELDLFGSSRSECAPRLRHSTQCCAPGRSALPLVAVGPRANVATTSSTTAWPCSTPISTLCPATATRTAHANGRRSCRGLRGSASAGRQLPSVSTSRSAPRSSLSPPPQQPPPPPPPSRHGAWAVPRLDASRCRSQLVRSCSSSWCRCLIRCRFCSRRSSSFCSRSVSCGSSSRSVTCVPRAASAPALPSKWRLSDATASLLSETPMIGRPLTSARRTRSCFPALDAAPARVVVSAFQIGSTAPHSRCFSCVRPFSDSAYSPCHAREISSSPVTGR
mmetsp:Transcript_29111/g.95798  ORF Transcript_29111/g.95798 Transcript_29111/m.95798 type:complete len:328 (-) Transcript_29111:2586-3569(-)